MSNKPSNAISGNGKENEWVAIELHDGLIQWIFSARMQLESLGKDLQQGGDEASAGKIATIQRILNSALRDGRGLIGFLEGESESDFASKNWLGQLLNFASLIEADAQVQNQELSIDANPDHWPTLSSLQAWNTLRIVQQAIINSVQHAGQCTISVRPKTLMDGLFEVAVRDDGAGFDTNASVPPDHFGLSSMQHRAKLIGGELNIDAQAGSGTTVTLRFNPSA